MLWEVIHWTFEQYLFTPFFFCFILWHWFPRPPFLFFGFSTSSSACSCFFGISTLSTALCFFFKAYLPYPLAISSFFIIIVFLLYYISSFFACIPFSILLLSFIHCIFSHFFSPFLFLSTISYSIVSFSYFLPFFICSMNSFFNLIDFPFFFFALSLTTSFFRLIQLIHLQLPLLSAILYSIILCSYPFACPSCCFHYPLLFPLFFSLSLFSFHYLLLFILWHHICSSPHLCCFFIYFISLKLSQTWTCSFFPPSFLYLLSFF